MIEAIFFDLDNTLINYRKANRIAESAFYLEIKDQLREVSQEELTKKRISFASRTFNDFLKGRITFEDRIIISMRDTFDFYNIDYDEEKLREVYSKLNKLYEVNQELFDDVIPCLDYLKDQKIPLGIITNGNSLDQRKKIKQFKLDYYFPAIFISGDFNTAKPDLNFFKICQDQIGIAANNLLYIGDIVEMDILPALKLGINAVWINRSQRKTKHDIFSIHSLNEVPKLLTKFN